MFWNTYSRSNFLDSFSPMPDSRVLLLFFINLGWMWAHASKDGCCVQGNVEEARCREREVRQKQVFQIREEGQRWKSTYITNSKGYSGWTLKQLGGSWRKKWGTGSSIHLIVIWIFFKMSIWIFIGRCFLNPYKFLLHSIEVFKRLNYP